MEKSKREIPNYRKLATLIIALPIMFGIFAFVTSYNQIPKDQQILGEIDSNLDVSKTMYRLDEESYHKFDLIEDNARDSFLDEDYAVTEFSGTLLEIIPDEEYIIEIRINDSELFYILQEK